jgi:putative Holliday junction resolvase
MWGPVLGLDFGARRIGLAVSNPEATLAFPAGTLERAGLDRDLAALRSLVEERGVARIVVGLPLHMDGRSGAGADAARAFAHALASATSLPVELLDERWTTSQAERDLREAPRARRRRRKQIIDSMAATLLLRTYLEVGRGHAEPSP